MVVKWEICLVDKTVFPKVQLMDHCLVEMMVVMRVDLMVVQKAHWLAAKMVEWMDFRVVAKKAVTSVGSWAYLTVDHSDIAKGGMTAAVKVAYLVESMAAWMVGLTEAQMVECLVHTMADQ